MARKKIKPLKKKRQLTEKQKEAQRLRLAEMRAKKKPPEYKNVSKYVLSLDDEEPYSLKNVKDWIKHNKEMVSMLQARARNRETSLKDKQHALNQADDKKAYIRYMEHYLRTGDWISDFMGPQENERTTWKCVAMAYNSDGSPKRSVGVFYPDINMVWKSDMIEADYVPVENIAITDKQFMANL